MRYAVILALIVASQPAFALDPSRSESSVIDRLELNTIEIRGPGSTGDASALTRRSSGATKVRSLGAVGADSLNFLDMAGSDPDGRADQSAALADAMRLAKATGRNFEIPYGNFRLNSVVTMPTDMGMIFGNPSFLTDGTKYIDGTSDFTPFLGRRAVRAFMRRSSVSGNEHTLYASVDAVPSASTTNYIKAAVYANATTQDPSLYGPGGVPGAAPHGNKDAVGLLANAEIRGGIRTGRVWAGNFFAGTSPGSDGLVTGIEIDLSNNSGTDAEELNSPRSKSGLTLISAGTNVATNALEISGAKTGKWANGINVYSGGLTRQAFKLISADNANRDIANLDRFGVWNAQKYTALGENTVSMTGAAAGAPGSIHSTNGPIALSASGANSTFLGSSTSPTVMTGNSFAGGVLTAQSGIVVAGGAFRLRRSPPSSPTQSCVGGEHTYDDDYAYYCVAANTWRRTKISAW